MTVERAAILVAAFALSYAMADSFVTGTVREAAMYITAVVAVFVVGWRIP